MSRRSPWWRENELAFTLSTQIRGVYWLGTWLLPLSPTPAFRFWWRKLPFFMKYLNSLRLCSHTCLARIRHLLATLSTSITQCWLWLLLTYVCPIEATRSSFLLSQMGSSQRWEKRLLYRRPSWVPWGLKSHRSAHVQSLFSSFCLLLHFMQLLETNQ